MCCFDLFRSRISLTSSRQCSATSSGLLSDRQQNEGWSDPAGRDSTGINPILTTADVFYSRIFHISSFVLLGDEFSCFVMAINVF